MFSIPNKQGRAGTTTTIEFRKLGLLVGGDFDFILQHASRPEHAHHVSLLGLSQADGEIRRVLPEISVGAVYFVFLANAVGENFDLGPDGALIAVQSLEREPHPVVLVAAFVLEQDGRAAVLGDEQVGGAVVVVVSGDDGARLFELDLVETNAGGDVFPSVGPQVAEQLYFAFAVFRLAHCDEVHPAVVVVVEGSDARRRSPIRRGKIDSIEGPSMVVSEQRNAADARAEVRIRHIHPSVVVEIKDRNPGGACDSWFGDRHTYFFEFALSRILKDDGFVTCDGQVNGAVVVEIRSYSIHDRGTWNQTRFA